MLIEIGPICIHMQFYILGMETMCESVCFSANLKNILLKIMLRDIASRDYISGHVQTSILSVSTAYRHSLLHIIGMDLWYIMGKLATYSLQSVCLWDGIPPLVNNVRVSAWIASFLISARF